MASGTEVRRVLVRHGHRLARVLDLDLTRGTPVVFDFTDANRDLARVDINDAAGFTEALFERIAEADPPVGVGRYGEDRVLYRHSPLFDGAAERRSVHLGIDLFAVEGTPVYAPLEGVVHSLGDNRALGDYGPTVILEHELDRVRFWTLYGHLDRETLDELEVGVRLGAGDVVGRLGDLHVNGGWPPHLHFQLIADVGAHRGDFPGVAALSERDEWLDRCPDPNLVLRIPGL